MTYDHARQAYRQPDGTLVPEELTAAAYARRRIEAERIARSKVRADRELAAELADYIVALYPMVVGWEVDARTDTVRLTLPQGYRAGVDLTHLRRGDADLVARRVVRAFKKGPTS